MQRILTLLVFLATTCGYAQSPAAEPTDGGPHSLHLELAGRGFLIGSVNYEYALKPQLALGAGLGVINLQSGSITRDNNGTPEEGTYFDQSSTQMLYGNYFVGLGPHQLQLTAGATHFFISYRNRYPSGTDMSVESKWGWNAGVGYQYSKGRGFFRATAYFLNLPSTGIIVPKNLPWLGLAGGLRL